MENELKTRTEQILKVMHILAWVAVVGLAVNAGAILISYGVTWINPDAAMNLYRGLDLDALRAFSFWHYSASVSFMVALLGMKMFVLILITRTMSNVNLLSPFTVDVARLLEMISYVLLMTWALAVMSNVHTSWLEKRTGLSLENSAAQEFFFTAGLVFIISQIFRRGVEIQSENELTV